MQTILKLPIALGIMTLIIYTCVAIWRRNVFVVGRIHDYRAHGCGRGSCTARINIYQMSSKCWYLA